MLVGDAQWSSQLQRRWRQLRLTVRVLSSRQRLALATACLLLLCLWGWPRPPAESVLHPRTPSLLPRIGFAHRIHSDRQQLSPQQARIRVSSESFAQYGTDERGLHYRLENDELLENENNRAQDSVLAIVVLNDAASWGEQRTVEDFFRLLQSFSYPQHKMSVAMLTSSKSEFDRIQQVMQHAISQYAQLTLLYRSDFNMDERLNRENRHQHALQTARRRMLARYRNFALLSTLQPWHQHVVWIDADVHRIPSDLLSRMIMLDRDILEPICLRDKADKSGTYEYDLNAWVGRRKTPSLWQSRSDFVPGDLSIQRMAQYRNGPDDVVPLDSVGGTMLYVRADVHRQGVLFPHHHIVGSEWEGEGYDGIETEGLCYAAHFLGFRCWGLPHDAIFHV
ncbi:hypothetical protein Poli38472_014719 [Pythium oligandrum]|uniref:Uncharacterized protein n=1 Tax=Pythium oligandrum TaxID=41045 RepID=A0A8K1C1Z9_PYTOL|nr:hypothetical protein Poli38472_014719 [Pythium oligandrum]|eukprot:TMW54948.1 hypothetical protein Poli38472_014719 [Pythium oligandrum]